MPKMNSQDATVMFDAWSTSGREMMEYYGHLFRDKESTAAKRLKLW